MIYKYIYVLVLSVGDPCYVDWLRREKQSDDEKLWSSYLYGSI